MVTKIVIQRTRLFFRGSIIKNWREHCPGVQALTVKICFGVTLFGMLAVKVTNIQTGVWERRDGCWCESRAWRFVDVNDLVSCNVYAQPLSLWLLIVLETDRPVTIPIAHEQTWQGRGSCSGLTQLVKSWESLAYLRFCSGSPVGRWWKQVFLRCLRDPIQVPRIR